MDGYIVVYFLSGVCGFPLFISRMSSFGSLLRQPSPKVTFFHFLKISAFGVSIPPRCRSSKRTFSTLASTQIVIFGGIPSVILEESVSDERFEEYMQELFTAVAPGDRFILGIADNMMPTSMLSRIKRIGELIEEKGTYPIKA